MLGDGHRGSVVHACGIEGYRKPCLAIRPGKCMLGAGGHGAAGCADGAAGAADAGEHAASQACSRPLGLGSVLGEHSHFRDRDVWMGLDV